MNHYNWKELLAKWSREILDSDLTESLPPEAGVSSWLGYPGATEGQINAAETRLEAKLPPSYREFLRTTNGWGVLTPFIDRIWSVEQIDWFRVRHQDWINAWNLKSSPRELQPKPVSDEEYFVYGERQNPGIVRREYLQTALEISKRGDSAIFLLIPQVITTDGEWEAWFFANWLPGARRYRSFWELMQAEYEIFLELKSP